MSLYLDDYLLSKFSDFEILNTVKTSEYEEIDMWVNITPRFIYQPDHLWFYYLVLQSNGVSYTTSSSFQTSGFATILGLI